jgi:hypothetical protein
MSCVNRSLPTLSPVSTPQHPIATNTGQIRILRIPFKWGNTTTSSQKLSDHTAGGTSLHTGRRKMARRSKC